MLKLDSKIDSTIPELFGFPKIENNIIEGFVIRPNTELKFNNDEDVLIKKKNKEFEENAYIPNLAKR